VAVGRRSEVDGLSTTGVELLLVFGALAAFLQTTTGFGGALVLAPVLFGTMRPAQAVLLAALLGTAQSAVLVVRYRDEILRHELATLLLFAVPGLAVGVGVLRVAPSAVLRVVVGASVIVATIVRSALAQARPGWTFKAAPAGFLAGVLTTSATVNGPPLVLYLLGRGATPAQMRATLAAVFIALDVLTLAALALGGALVWPPLSGAVALVVAMPFGIAAGFWAGDRMPAQVYARAVTGLLLALGVASIVAGVTA
jgi:uncharacterized membrane protein YfcA